MSAKQAFWDVSTKQGEPDLWVCMSCLNEVFFRKVPMPDCPTCHGVSTYEAFTLDAVRDWGTEVCQCWIKSECEYKPSGFATWL